jgi:glycosyltransferase involved in cell wall biosynthesis
VNVALIHDWLTGMRGGEKVLEVLCELFPEAKIFTLVHIRGSVSSTIEALPIETSFIQKLPRVETKYRSYLPFFPAAIETFDLRGYDLILSSSHCVAKGAIPGAGAFHICYCHTPMRYVWAMYEEYFGSSRIKGLKRWIIPHVASYLRVWDSGSCHRVDRFVANSRHVRNRIERYYGRNATVIYPPVETEGTYLSERDEGYYLIVSAFAPYKRIDIAVEAFKRLGRKLVIIGSGQEEKRLRRMAGSETVFLGWAARDDLRKYYAGSKALIFPGEEDFGIVPVEAQCFGKPVIAFGAGGVLETVNGLAAGGEVASSPACAPTGLFFDRQTPDALIEAIERFESISFDHEAIRVHAMAFDREVFKQRISAFVADEMSKR